MVHQNEGLQKIYETSSKEMIMLKAPLVKMAKLLPMVYECSNTKSVVAMC